MSHLPAVYIILLKEYSNIFNKPGAVAQWQIQHQIELIDDNKVLLVPT